VSYDDLWITNDGKLDAVTSKRDQVGADLVILLMDYVGTDEFGNSLLGRVAEVGAQSSSAFGIVSVNGTIPLFVFEHEVGHLMGGTHDDDTRLIPFTNARGFYYPNGSGSFCTIMVRGGLQNYCQRLQIYSTPQMTIYSGSNPNGVPAGNTHTNYAADIWTNYTPVVSAFRTPPPPPAPLAVTMSGPTYVDTKTSATYTASVSGGGPGTVTYAWYRRDTGSSTFYYTGCNTQSCTQQSAFSDFEIKVTVAKGNETQSLTRYVTVGGDFISATGEDGSSPAAFEVFAPHPNPVRSASNLGFRLADDASVTVRIYDALGREVAEVVNGSYAAGEHAIPFERDGLPAGVYLYQINATTAEAVFSASNRLILL
jgi:hypothetical protein